MGKDCAIHITLPRDSGDSIFPCRLLFSFVATTHTHTRGLVTAWERCAFVAVGSRRLYFIYLFSPLPPFPAAEFGLFSPMPGRTCQVSRGKLHISAVDFSPHAHHNFQAGSPGGFFFVFPAAGLSSPNLGSPAPRHRDLASLRLAAGTGPDLLAIFIFPFASVAAAPN